MGLRDLRAYTMGFRDLDACGLEGGEEVVRGGGGRHWGAEAGPGRDESDALARVDGGYLEGGGGSSHVPCVIRRIDGGHRRRP